MQLALASPTDVVQGFNPCFNGFMDKCPFYCLEQACNFLVSTLVLMDSWINAGKTEYVS